LCRLFYRERLVLLTGSEDEPYVQLAFTMAAQADDAYPIRDCNNHMDYFDPKMPSPARMTNGRKKPKGGGNS
jgi:hypothetical protein